MFGAKAGEKLLVLECGEQVADGSVAGERVRPGETAGDEAAKTVGGSDERGEAGGDLNFRKLARAEKGEAGRIGFHDLGEAADGGDGHLREGPRGAPEPDSFRVSSLTEQRGKLGAEFFMRHPHRHSSLPMIKDRSAISRPAKDEMRFSSRGR